MVHNCGRSCLSLPLVLLLRQQLVIGEGSAEVKSEPFNYTKWLEKRALEKKDSSSSSNSSSSSSHKDSPSGEAFNYSKWLQDRASNRKDSASSSTSGVAAARTLLDDGAQSHSGDAEAAALQAVLNDPAQAADHEAVRAALLAAKSAGTTQTQLVAAAEQKLKDLALAELEACLEEEHDLERLADAIERAHLDGLSSAQTRAAETQRDRLLASRLAAATLSDDIGRACTLIQFGDRHAGPDVADQIAGTRTALRETIARALSAASVLARTNPSRLRAAVDCGRQLGAEAASLEAGLALLQAEDKRVEVDKAMTEATEQRDWLALIFSVMEAKRAGLSAAEMETAVAMYTQGVRQQLQEVQGSSDLQEVCAALQLAGAAGLPESELDPLRQQAAVLSRKMLTDAEGTRDVRQIQRAINMAVHLSEAELEAARTRLVTLLCGQLQAVAVATQPDAAALGPLLAFSLQGQFTCGAGEVQQAASRFLAVVEAELEQAAHASDYGRVQAALSSTRSCGGCLELALGDDADAGLRLGQLINRAGDARDREWSKAVRMEELTDALTSEEPEPASIQLALANAREAGWNTQELEQYELQAARIEAEQSAAATAITAAMAAGEPEALQTAITQGELVGLGRVDPGLLTRARAALAGL